MREKYDELQAFHLLDDVALCQCYRNTQRSQFAIFPTLHIPNNDALLRPGRLDQLIYIPLPDLPARQNCM